MKKTLELSNDDHYALVSDLTPTVDGLTIVELLSVEAEISIAKSPIAAANAAKKKTANKNKPEIIQQVTGRAYSSMLDLALAGNVTMRKLMGMEVGGIPVIVGCNIPYVPQISKDVVGATTFSFEGQTAGPIKAGSVRTITVGWYLSGSLVGSAITVEPDENGKFIAGIPVPTVTGASVDHTLRITQDIDVPTAHTGDCNLYPQHIEVHTITVSDPA